MSVSEPTTAEAAGAGPGPGWGERARTAGGALLGQREFVILVFLLVICTAIGIARPTFFSTGNLLAMGRQMAEIAVMAVGATFLITARELDLSVGSVYGFCTLLMAALAINTGLDLWLGLMVSLGVAALLPAGHAARLAALFGYTALAKQLIFEPLWLWQRPLPLKAWRELRLGPAVMALPWLYLLALGWFRLRGTRR